MLTNQKRSSPTSELRVDESTKTMQQLLNEIDQIQTDVQAKIKSLERIDATAHRDRAIEGRKQIQILNERVANLQTRMNLMTNKSDPRLPIKQFDKSKGDALKTLSNLSTELHRVDQYLQKLITEEESSEEDEVGSHKSPSRNTNQNATSVTNVQRIRSAPKSIQDDDEEEEETSDDEDDDDDDDDDETANKQGNA